MQKKILILICCAVLIAVIVIVILALLAWCFHGNCLLRAHHHFIATNKSQAALVREHGHLYHRCRAANHSFSDRYTSSTFPLRSRNLGKLIKQKGYHGKRGYHGNNVLRLKGVICRHHGSDKDHFLPLFTIGCHSNRNHHYHHNFWTFSSSPM